MLVNTQHVGVETAAESIKKAFMSWMSTRE